MRVPVSWLRSLCDPALPTAALAERLAMTGTEVERVETVGVASTEGFVVGRVLSAEPHPDADRLRVCSVDDGASAPRTIVCGAPNVRARQTVGVALPGAVMLDGTPLGEAKLRGVVSSGMILAEDEVGLGEDHAGIMALPEGPAPGTPLSDVLPIAEQVLELEITPNRPDCLGLYGVARELHAATGAALAEDPGATDAEPTGGDRAQDHASVRIQDRDVCRRFTARVFEDVRVGPSPSWLRARLYAAGQRPISNVVDVTNYVMLLTGQPLHAFDLDEVRGDEVVVRRARQGERMATLDGVERTFDATMALVCDSEGPTGIAGIMGGQVSEVSEATTRVLMEAATWVGPNVLSTSSRLGLRSEASGRFEKQLHPDQALAAQRVAAKLMVEVCGARLVPGTLDEYPAPARPRTVELRLSRLGALLGTTIPPAEVVGILERLGLGVGDGAADALAVSIPGYRDGDLRREADLVEEVARIHGLDSLPVSLPARRRAVGRIGSAQRLRRRLEDLLRDRGLHEAVAWSFTSPEKLAWLRLDGEGGLVLGNPLSEDASVLRPLLLPGLLDAAAHNAARDRRAVALFESAHVYRRDPYAPEAPAGSPLGARPAHERHHLAGVLGEVAPAGWRTPARPADFFAVRGLVEAVMEAARVEWAASPSEGRPFLHPGRSATLSSGRTELGWVGEVHPLVTRAWGVPGPVAAFELDADLLAELAPGARSHADVTSFPAVLQDIAVVVPEERSAAEVELAVREGGGDLLRRTRVFDLYRGEQVGADAKSIALELEFRAPDRTLTEDEVAGLRADIERSLEPIGGRIRG